MSATRRKDNNRIQEKDDQEMGATVFNSQETPSGLFTLEEMGTEENSGKVASWEFLTALSQCLVFRKCHYLFNSTRNSNSVVRLALGHKL